MDIALVIAALVLAIRGWSAQKVALLWAAGAVLALALDFYRFADGMGFDSMWVEPWAIAWLLILPLATLVAFAIGNVIYTRRISKG